MDEEFGVGRAPAVGDAGFLDISGFFDISGFEPRSVRRRQVLVLALGLASVWLGHEIAAWAHDAGTTSVRLWTTAVVVFGLIEIGRAISQFVVSVSTRQARVFRWRHLAVCGAGLLAVAVVLLSSLLVRDPLRNALSRGTIGAEDIADVGFVVAAGICLGGAVAAAISAVVELRSQVVWKRSHPRLH